MKLYIVSLGAGLLVSVIYGVLKVRSPAPPVIALIGLLGILLGEQIPPLLQSLLRQPSTVRSWRDQVHPHVFGQLPRGEMREAGEVDHV